MSCGWHPIAWKQTWCISIIYLGLFNNRFDSDQVEYLPDNDLPASMGETHFHSDLKPYVNSKHQLLEWPYWYICTINFQILATLTCKQQEIINHQPIVETAIFDDFEHIVSSLVAMSWRDGVVFRGLNDGSRSSATLKQSKSVTLKVLCHLNDLRDYQSRWLPKVTTATSFTGSRMLLSVYRLPH